MRRRLLSFLGAAALVGALFGAPTPVAAKDNVLQLALKGELPPAKIHTSQGDRKLPTFSASLLQAAQGEKGNTKAGRAAAGAAGARGSENGPGEPNVSGGGGDARNALAIGPGGLSCARRNTDGNVRVNQDCGYRQQAEELIKWNPRDPNNLIAGMNDLRQGYNLGAFAFSFDGGRTWGDDPPPFYQKLNAPECEQAASPPYCLRDLAPDPNNHTILGTPGNYFTYDGGSDPALAFDLEGRAFFSLIIFDRVAGDGSAVVVTQSPAGAGGSFYNNLRQFTRRFVVAEDKTVRPPATTSSSSPPTSRPAAPTETTSTRPGPFSGSILAADRSRTRRATRAIASHRSSAPCPRITESPGRRPRRSAAPPPAGASSGTSWTRGETRTPATSTRARTRSRCPTATLK